jgi:putative ABC transport system permease protein
LLPFASQLSGKPLLFSLADPKVWTVIGTAIIASLAVASVYPALLLSSFKPLDTLRGKISMGMGKVGFRKVLVVTQFVFSVGLIISTLVIGSQLNYIKEKDLGFDKEQVLSVALSNEQRDRYDMLKSELLKQPGILGVTGSGNNLVGIDASTSDTDWDGKEEGTILLVRPNAVDHSFIPMFRMKMVAGSNFSGTPADSTKYILNEAAVRLAGIKDPIGKSFSLWEKKGVIAGVVKDFNYASLKQSIEPVIFMYRPYYSRMYIKTTGRDASAAINAIRKTWRASNADIPPDYSFLDDEFNRIYEDDQRTGKLFASFAAIAIFISCLGLFGLATYTAQVKLKEIGIRKVLGATTTGITALLSRDFLRLVVLAFVIASPLTWIAMNKWLENYSYRVAISWWIFAATGVIAIIVALFTVSIQAIRASMRNPVLSLRTE